MRKNNLKERLASFDALKADGSGTREGSKFIRTQGGKFVMYHRPGSQKK